MKNTHKGMSLFELLIVMTIIGVVYSIGVFTLKTEKTTAQVLNLSTLKTTLLALNTSGRLRLICDAPAQECRIFSNDGKMIKSAHLQSNGTIQRYGYDRFGELHPLGNVIVQNGGKSVQSSFEFILNPDRTVTPLILKNNERFYVYTPLGEDKPFVSENEEQLRAFLFDEGRYPLKGDDTYGTY